MPCSFLPEKNPVTHEDPFLMSIQRELNGHGFPLAYAMPAAKAAIIMIMVFILLV